MNQTLFSELRQTYLATCTNSVSFLSVWTVLKYAFYVVSSRLWCFLCLTCEIVLGTKTHTCAWIFPKNLLACVSAIGATKWNESYFALKPPKREDLEKENVCLVAERLVGDWLMVWKGAIESKQYLSFIKFIILNL